MSLKLHYCLAADFEKHHKLEIRISIRHDAAIAGPERPEAFKPFSHIDDV